MMDFDAEFMGGGSALDDASLLLSIILWHPETLQEVRWLDPEAFLNPNHQRLYRAICHVVDEFGPDNERVINETMTLLNRYPRTELIRALLVDLTSSDRAFPSQALYHAKRIYEVAQREEVRKAVVRSQQIFSQDIDLSTMVSQLRDEWETALGLAEAAAGFRPVEGLSTADEFLQQTSKSHDWVIPGLLEATERLILVAPVKAGKSVLTRQVALSLAQGRHPLWSTMEIPKKRCLIVDLENPGGIVRRDLKRQMHGMGNLEENAENLWVWHQPAGIHLGDHNDVTDLERAIDVSGAEFVAICPLYKTYDGLGESWEQQAFGVQKPLDRLRSKYGCALWMEHHAPKGAATELFGSSRWARWFDLKVSLIPEDPDAPPPYDSLRWSATYREENRIKPFGLERGKQMSWEARFPDAFERLMEAANQE